MPTASTPLRYALECQDLPWMVLDVEERTSLARPPSLVLEVTTDRRSTELVGIERSTASVLIEGPDLTRVVRGWVRYVEHVGVVDSRAHLRLHLAPMAMAEDAPARRVEAPAQEPAMLISSAGEQPGGPKGVERAAEPTLVSTPLLVEPPSTEQQDVTVEHTPDELRAMRGEDPEGETHRRPVDRPITRKRRELTEVMRHSDAQDSKRKRRRAAEDDTAEHGTRLVTFAELHATLGGGRVDQPERLRRKKRKADNETTQMTWAEIEALHQDRGKPKP